MAARAIFYQLTHKYVPTEADLPAGPRQVVFYSLAIGHHVGVLDCLQPVLEVALEEYGRWLARLPDGTARLKLEGLLKWGEIEINASHAGSLLAAMGAERRDGAQPEAHWTATLAQALRGMLSDPALYLMVRRGE